MYYFRIPFVGVFFLSDDWIPLITVLWLLGMTQAINLIDGLDGLAAGIVAIAAGAFFLYGQRSVDLEVLRQPNFGPMVAIIAVGLCVGFLPHNFNPARIIMGDCGALLLGLLMAVSTSVVGGRADPDRAGLLRPDVLLPRAARAAAVHPRHPGARPAVRHRPPGDAAQGARRGRQGAPPPPADEPRARASTQRADPVDVDGAAVGVRPLSGADGREPPLPARSGWPPSGSCCTRCSTRACAGAGGCRNPRASQRRAPALRRQDARPASLFSRSQARPATVDDHQRR